MPFFDSIVAEMQYAMILGIVNVVLLWQRGRLSSCVVMEELGEGVHWR